MAKADPQHTALKSPIGAGVQRIGNDQLTGELTMADYLDAEHAAGGNHPLNFSAHLLARHVQVVAEADKPLTMVEIRELPPADFRHLLAGQHVFEITRHGCTSLDILRESAHSVQQLLGRPAIHH